MSKNITAFTDKSELGRAIEGVRIEPERIVATDSFKLIEIIEHTGAEDSFTVKLPKGLKSFERVERTEAGAYLHKGGASYSGQILHEEYPKLEGIIPTGEPNATIKLNPEFLGEICKAFTEGRAIPEMTIAYYGANKPLVFTREDGLLKAVLAPMIN